MDGLIVLNKPPGISSAKALYRVRKITRVRKSGHAGTLDPAAGGVLLVCLGRGTKLVERLMDLPKVYRAAARLDVTSAGFDSDDPLIDVPNARVPTSDELRAALARFVGTIQQTPPELSAVKIRGKPAYKLARAGRTVELKPRPVRIDWIHLECYQWPALEFELACGRGTYVRSLIRDLGTVLNSGGCLTGLTRTAIGPFRLDDSATFEDLERAPEWDRYLVPLDRAAEIIQNEGARRPPPPDICDI